MAWASGQRLARWTKYESTNNDIHLPSKLRLKRVFELVDPAGESTYANIASHIPNEQELARHSCRQFPVVQDAGRMFGDSVYYPHGFWTEGGRDNNCFMLLSDVATGSECRPGLAWVRDHEAIVWNTVQIGVRYLCEFDS